MGIFAKTFESIGVSRQYSALNAKEADRQFSNSCKICCNKGIKLDCDRCAINYTHNLVCTYVMAR